MAMVRSGGRPSAFHSRTALISRIAGSPRLTIATRRKACADHLHSFVGRSPCPGPTQAETPARTQRRWGRSQCAETSAAALVRALRESRASASRTGNRAERGAGIDRVALGAAQLDVDGRAAPGVLDAHRRPVGARAVGVAPGQHGEQHGAQVAARGGEPVLVALPRPGLAVGDPVDDASSTRPASRRVSTLRAMPRWAARSSKRRTPLKRSRSTSTVQPSPTTSAVRATEHRRLSRSFHSTSRV